MNSNLTKLPSQKLLAILAIPMLIALGISGYLTYASVTASEIAGCGGGSIFDCGHVLYSKWSKFAGIPVSGLALLTYIGMIIAGAMTFHRDNTQQVREWAWTALTASAVAASFAAVYFIFLQVVVLQHLCWYCLVAHTCGLAIAATALYHHRIPLPRLSGISTGIAICMAILITVQVNSSEPPKYKIESYNPAVQVENRTNASDDSGTYTDSNGDLFSPPEDDLFAPPEDDLFAPPQDDLEPPTEDDDHSVTQIIKPLTPFANQAIAFSALMMPTTSTAVAAVSVQPQEDQKQQDKPKKKQKRVVSFSGNKLDVSQWPLAGSPDASYIFVEMFDYTCPHCRSMHDTIKSAKKNLKDDVAIISLPVPMNRACNSTVQQDAAVHMESCQLSNLAIGVWRLDKAKFNKFHDWMFENKACPTYGTAYKKASEMVGQEKLDAELQKGMAQKYVQKHVMLYQRVGAGQIPKILFPTTTIVGEFSSAGELAKMIKQQAGK